MPLPAQPSSSANTCRQCHQRITRGTATARTIAKALEVRADGLWLLCQCGVWNRAPERLCQALRFVLVL
jgi:hypothetical protein